MKHLIFGGLAVGLIIFIWAFRSDDHPVAELRKQANLIEDEPFLMIHADPRSLTARRFVGAMERYLDEQNTELTLVVKSTGKRSFKSLAPATKAISEPLREPMKPNHFFLFLEGDQPVLEGEVFADHNQVVDRLSRAMGIRKPFVLRDYLEEGTQIQSTPFFSAIQHLPRGPMSAFVVFQDICMVCNSGRTLLEIEQLNQDIPNVHFTFLTVTPYTPEQLTDFVQSHELTVPIYIAGTEFEAFWQGLAFAQGSHPLEGLIFVISAEGTLIFAGNIADPEPFQRWLKHQSGTNMEKGE